VSIHHLGAAIGTMNFVRTLMATILVAVFGAIVLAAVPVAAVGDVLSPGVLSGVSVAAFAAVFFAAAGTLTVALIAMLAIEEKPLESTIPTAPRS
jgi:hypothetical protein